jgi:hypothetical protein
MKTFSFLIVEAAYAPTVLPMCPERSATKVFGWDPG